MLGTLTAAMALLSASQTGRYTLSTTIQPWSTATFEVTVNDRKLPPLGRKEKVDLGPYLRPGDNTVEVRYRTDDGKPSFHQPALLTIESWDGTRRKTELRLAASLDNPRGRLQVRL